MPNRADTHFLTFNTCADPASRKGQDAPVSVVAFGPKGGTIAFMPVDREGVYRIFKEAERIWKALEDQEAPPE